MLSVQEQLGQLAAISSAVYAFIEFLKPYIKIYFAPLEGLSEDTKAAVYRLLNLVFCVLIVLSAGRELNLFQDNAFFGLQVPMAGLILTGIATGLGSTVLNFVASWATLRFETIPSLEALKVKAEALKIVTTIPANANYLEAELREEKV